MLGRKKAGAGSPRADRCRTGSVVGRKRRKGAPDSRALLTEERHDVKFDLPIW